MYEAGIENINEIAKTIKSHCELKLKKSVKKIDKTKTKNASNQPSKKLNFVTQEIRLLSSILSSVEDINLVTTKLNEPGNIVSKPIRDNIPANSPYPTGPNNRPTKR